MTDNRRTSTRHEVSIPAQVTVDGEPRESTIVNLSLGGALVDTGAKHPMGARMNISFRLPTMEDMVEVGSTVRWSDAKGVGLQFDGLRARDVWALNEFFKQLASS
ncbi:MAG: PilZ domain-containing protein [Deltaproteobacteria bacterium]|nr:PilZ domain-containing protein [Deltaproteobacteria bacterium]